MTLRELAEALGTTKKGAKYWIEKIPDEYISRNGKELVIDPAALQEIEKLRGKKRSVKREDFPPTSHTLPTENKELPTDQEGSTREVNRNYSGSTREQEGTTSHPLPTNNDDFYKDIIDTLKDELNALHAQLDIKDKQIAALSDSLLIAQKTAADAQALHAGSLQKMLAGDTENGTTEDPPTDEKQPGKISKFFSSLFK